MTRITRRWRFALSVLFALSVGLIGTTCLTPAAGADSSDSEKVTFVTQGGQPLTAGGASWALDDGSARSANQYPLDATGSVVFPRVIPGAATIKVVQIVYPDGVSVGGTFDVILGSGPLMITVPTEATLTTEHVDVQLPNGQPVVGARFTAFDYLPSQVKEGAYTFYFPCHPTQCDQEPRTDSDGKAYIDGFADPSATPSGVVTYNDGTLYQQKRFTFDDSDSTTVQLAYMPWLTVDQTPGATPIGNLDDVALQERSHQSGNSVDRTTSENSASADATDVKLVPPAGWTAARCKKKSHLAGTVTLKTKVHLGVCGSVSGYYRVQSHGAVTAGKVLVRVKGSVPMAPQYLVASSPKAHEALLSWPKPVYNGGAAITGYKITLVSGERKTPRSVTVKSSSIVKTRHYLWPHLTELAVDFFRVQPITHHGLGRSAQAGVQIV